jgi:HKD family nuclease
VPVNHRGNQAGPVLWFGSIHLTRTGTSRNIWNGDQLALIDNVNRTLQESLANALETSDSIDIAVGYFYMSGFEALAEQLRNKKVRILVGMEIDPAHIAEIASLANHNDVNLDRWQPRSETRSSSEKAKNYQDALVGFINDSSTFEDPREQDSLDLFLSKIEDGTLEIRKTRKDAHWKIYLTHNKKEFSHGGDFPGVVFQGSSNMTYSGLVGQGELNSSSKDKSQFDELQAWFNAQWNAENSIIIADETNRSLFVTELKNKVWKYQLPRPVDIYNRVLLEHFTGLEETDILTPSKITNGEYWDLAYQVDAVKMAIDRLEKYDGAIIADVAGLGKSIIGSCVARNLDMKTVIVAPPHIVPQWEELSLIHI